jgi:uncharacterized protein YjbI with pentapeptide repeats
MASIFRTTTGDFARSRLPLIAMVFDLGWAQNRAQSFGRSSLARQACPSPKRKSNETGRSMAAPENHAASAKESSPTCCAVEMRGSKLCGRPIHQAPVSDPTPVCLMHSHDPKKSDLEFQKEFEAVLKAATSEENATANFTGFVFPSANYRGRDFVAWSLLWETTFTNNTDFGGVTFTKGAHFGGAKFTKKVTFGEANFMEGSYFRCAEFMQDASFGEATFKEEADFLEARFTKNVDFGKTSFTRADFFEATFMQEASFVGATFSQSVDFSHVTFTQDADFNCVEFVQDAYLGATFGQKSAADWGRLIRTSPKI